MKRIKDNSVYFKISQDNPEPHLDRNYFFSNKYEKLSSYLLGVKEIKEVLITIKKLKENDEDIEVIEKYYKNLFEVFNNEYSNCSELGCFVNACDSTNDLIKKDYKAFKTITDLFIKKRKIDDKVPENWVQAIIDSNSSRRKGDLGEKKLISILNKFGFIEVDNWNDFYKNKKCVVRFSKETFSTVGIRSELGIKIHTKKQDKRLDLLFKYRRKIFLLEAKHLNVGGGEQDKQISELIEILSLKEVNKSIHYISFLDGTYSNNLLGYISKRSKKKLRQNKEIKNHLKNNSRNYWVNTAGFKAFIFNLV